MAEQQIIIKRTDDHGDHDHHGGGWKVAYADFMTAMMAFFLMLWIISAADEQKLQGLAEYFTPVATTDIMGGEGFLDGQVFGPDGVHGGVDGQSFQVQPPSFGRNDPISQPNDTPLATEPRVVVEYADGPRPGDNPVTDPASMDRGEETQIEPALEAARAERIARLEDVTDEIEAAVAANLALVEMESNLRIDRTPEGLLIQILDQENRPMFASGSARIDAATGELVKIIGLAVADLPYPLAITGHTDSVPFTGRSDYGNWELSADRANATRRALLAAGVGEARVSRVSGLADTMPLNLTSPDAPENRRITMLLIYPDPTLGPAGSGNAAPAPGSTESVE